MPRALLYYLAQTWTADLHRKSQRGAPARAAGQDRHRRPPGRRCRVRGLPAVSAHRMLTVLGGGSAK
jgi:hypothetical protein